MASSGTAPHDDNSSVSAVHRALHAVSFVPSTQQPGLIGFSGGLDSGVLLHAAAQVFGADAIVAVHVHHGLQSQADDWATHCREEAARIGVRCDIRYARPAPSRFPGGLENWARDQRRAAILAAVLDHCASHVLLAHHADDQIETVLLNLIRGAGPDGLAGMRAERLRDGVPVARPFLALPKSVLTEYALQAGLRVVDDPSNRDVRLARNRLRHQILPSLNLDLPGFDRSLLLAAANAADVVQALQISLFGDDGPPLELNRTTLAAKNPIVAAQMLRIWLQARQLRAPGRARLRHLTAQLIDSPAIYAQVPHDGHLVCRYRDRIVVRVPTRHDADRPGRLSVPVPLRWRGNSPIRLPGFAGVMSFVPVPAGTPGLPSSLLRSDQLMVSAMRTSARIRTRADGPSRRLKQLCQERGIARWARPGLPMLWHGEEPLFVAGIGINAGLLRASCEADPAYIVHWSPESTNG